jgi:hypothetical protein
MITIDSDDSFGDRDLLLTLSSQAEGKIAFVAIRRNQFEIAEGHCKRCLVNSRRLGVEGEDKTTLIFEALNNYTFLRQHQGDPSGAVIFAEEAYNLVVEAYDPVHLQVQEAASCLIECLIQQGDLFNGERFAEQTYANLKDSKNGINQEGEQVAEGAYNLADVIFQKDDGDLIKAGKLARESLRIRTQLYGTNHNKVGTSCILLARILVKQRKFGDETKDLFERSLANFKRNEGPDGVCTAIANIEIGQFQYNFAMMQSVISTKRTQLLLAKSYFEEGIRIETNLHSPSHPNRVDAASLLSKVLNELSRV